MPYRPVTQQTASRDLERILNSKIPPSPDLGLLQKRLDCISRQICDFYADQNSLNLSLPNKVLISQNQDPKNGLQLPFRYLLIQTLSSWFSRLVDKVCTFCFAMLHFQGGQTSGRGRGAFIESSASRDQYLPLLSSFKASACLLLLAMLHSHRWATNLYMKWKKWNESCHPSECNVK